MEKIKILIVEDERLIAEDLKLTLEDLGYDIAGITGFGEEAVDLSEKIHPDLVLMDIKLEGKMNGIEAAEQIQSKFNIPFVYLTAYSDNKLLEQAKLTEPYGYIIKPFDYKEVQSTIEIGLYKSKVEKELKQSKEEWENIFNNISDWVCLIDLEGKILRSNRSGEKFTGIPLDEILGKKCCRLIHNSDKRIPGCPILNLLKSKKREDSEIKLKEKNKWFLITVDPIFDENKELKGAVHITRDITDRKRAEEELRSLSSITEQITDGIIVTDLDYKITYANKVIEELYGFSLKEIQGRTPYFLNAESKAKEIQDSIIQRISEGKIWYSTFLNRRKDKSTFISEIKICSLRDLEGKIYAYMGTIRDVTDRIKAENDLRDSEARLRRFYDSGLAGFARTRVSDGKLLEVNDYMVELLGYNDRETCLTEYIGSEHWVDPKGREKMLKQLKKSGSIRDIEEQITRRNGEKIWVSYSGVLYPDEDYIEYVITNITESKYVVEALRESEERLTSFMDSATDAFVLYDSNLDLIEINKTALQYMKTNKDEMLGKNIKDISPGIEKSGRYDKYLEVMKIGTPFFLDDLIPNPKYGDIHVTVKAFKVGSGLGMIFTDMTERIKAEHALKESEDRLKGFMNSATDNFFLLDSKLNIVDINDHAVKSTSDKKQNIIGKNIVELLPDVKKSDRYEQYIEVIRTGTPMIEEDIISNPRYGQKHFSVKVFKVGEGLGVISSDITKQKLAEEAIKESEEKYRLLFQNASEGILHLDTKGNILDANPMIMKFAGCKRSDVVGKNFRNLSSNFGLAQEDLEVAFRYSLKDREQKEIEWNIKNNMGRELTVLAHPAKIEKNGDLIGINYMIEDITERKKTEEILKTSAHLWKTTFDTITDAVCLLDADGKIMQCNKAMEKIVGGQSKKIIGEFCHNIFHDKDEPFENCPLIRSRNSHHRENLIIKEDNSWFKITVDPIFDASGTFNGAVHIRENITKRKQMEEDLKLSLNEREVLYGELKHRVKNNLQLLISMVDMQIRKSDDISISMKLKEIKSVVETMALIYTKAFEGTRFMNCNFNNFLEDLFAVLIKIKPREDLKIYYTIEGDNIFLPPNQAIPLAFIVNEFIFNSLKHAFIGRDEGFISILIKDFDNEVNITLKDNGVGISPDINIDKPESLGLRLVKRLTKQLKGNLEIFVDNGTIYKLNIKKIEGVL